MGTKPDLLMPYQIILGYSSWTLQSGKMENTDCVYTERPDLFLCAAAVMHVSWLANLTLGKYVFKRISFNSESDCLPLRFRLRMKLTFTMGVSCHFQNALKAI